MSKYLIVYSTTEGQTKKISQVLASEIKGAGHQVEIEDVRNLPRINGYDGIIIGGSVHMSSFNKELKDWVKINAETLATIPSAFFSVCLGILETDNRLTQEAEKKIVLDFFDETHWHPRNWTIFAGALKYSEYNFVKKLMLKAIVKKAGRTTHMDQDYEYTDWAAVKQFAHETERSFG